MKIDDLKQILLELHTYISRTDIKAGKQQLGQKLYKKLYDLDLKLKNNEITPFDFKTESLKAVKDAKEEFETQKLAGKGFGKGKLQTLFDKLENAYKKFEIPKQEASKQRRVSGTAHDFLRQARAEAKKPVEPVISVSKENKPFPLNTSFQDQLQTAFKHRAARGGAAVETKEVPKPELPKKRDPLLNELNAAIEARKKRAEEGTTRQLSQAPKEKPPEKPTLHEELMRGIKARAGKPANDDKPDNNQGPGKGR